MQQTQLPGFEAAILARVVQPNRDDLSPASVCAFLKFDFTDDDREKMHKLAVKNQSGKLTAAGKTPTG